MNKLFANPIFTAVICFAATILGHGLHVLIYHNTFNLYTSLIEAGLFAILGFVSLVMKNSRKAMW